jgi:hypothetical protein
MLAPWKTIPRTRIRVRAIVSADASEENPGTRYGIQADADKYKAAAMARKISELTCIVVHAYVQYSSPSLTLSIGRATRFSGSPST